MKKKTIGFAVTGSFCTFAVIIEQLKSLTDTYNIIPIFSYAVAHTDTRFTTAGDFRAEVVRLTGNQPLDTIPLAEPVGPKALLDLLVVAPCTGNTLSKISLAITDTPVTMAVKAHLRNNKPVVIAVSSNDALGLNFKNLGSLLNAKNIYFVPFGQDDSRKKPNSLVADMTLIGATVEAAFEGVQIQPLLFTKG